MVWHWSVSRPSPRTNRDGGQIDASKQGLLRRLAARGGAVYSRETEGQVAEWLKAHAWKVCNGESRSRVRIPLCPPYYPKSDRETGLPAERSEADNQRPETSI